MSRRFWGGMAALGPIAAGLALAPLGAGDLQGRTAPSVLRPGTQAPVAAITFAAGKNGANIDRGLQQVLAGGRAQDSRYICRRWDGRSAEIFTGPGSPSYIYLRLDRRSRFFLARPKVLYVTVTWAAAGPPTALLARGGCGLAVHTIQPSRAWPAPPEIRPRFIPRPAKLVGIPTHGSSRMPT